MLISSICATFTLLQLCSYIYTHAHDSTPARTKQEAETGGRRSWASLASSHLVLFVETNKFKASSNSKHTRHSPLPAQVLLLVHVREPEASGFMAWVESVPAGRGNSPPSSSSFVPLSHLPLTSCQVGPPSLSVQKHSGGREATRSRASYLDFSAKQQTVRGNNKDLLDNELLLHAFVQETDLVSFFYIYF